MSRRDTSRGRATGPGRPFARTDRIGELVRELVAEELERIADERLELVTITSADVDGDLARARVYYSAVLATEEGRSAEVAEALEQLRWPIQQVINRSVRARKTPQISFVRDTSIEAGLRIEAVLAGLDPPSDQPFDESVYRVDEPADDAEAQ
ncbi:MAG: 30S ribosome-binding factor RbfA [Candidatus Microthrix subdominans]|jgi:ribosome-binding factor A|uniref:Ribosome-binding factor A n=1 Tax=Candidatus Neomicrothrix subdominans TaxID=2954438 RepID=A0A936TE67_9ACTN|nr:30S ribosome-binding factor RbfA [Candidatus Microthrix sp.]MBK9296369.1 30S ribosome-binding factor RbfA [Candidatus Microthrix subdominans]MBK6439247.1 30S ribosome-binding factor RbfA [Candidatus Microthrix sp.]MBK9558159.1 30S ribosome-binding factor RbfA [Candidatus Microthrix sp.]MBP7596701.1 30S ribosome-binding factor RbfA [Candidatus Microthrix sp.]MBP9066951.1 30S ribosome-binding factor RbfA [Candidatus Microthrix sp.]